MSTVSDSKILHLDAMVEYQTASIVSRPVANSEGGNITLFAFDAGQELSEHSSPYNAFAFILEGQVEIKISGTPFLLISGESILMPANIPHSVHAIEKFKMVLTMLRG